jgi:capsular polysaccharide biosynthesis protein
MRRHDFVRGVIGRRRQAGRLARWWLFGLTNLARPARLRLKPPPWQRAPTAVPARPWTITVPITRPTIYGDIVPEKFNRLPTEAKGNEPGVTIVDDVVLVPSHLFVDRRSAAILPQSYDVAMLGGAVAGLESRPPKLFTLPEEVEQVFVVESNVTNNFGHNLLEAMPRLLLLDQAPAGIEIATSLPRSATFETLVRGMGIDPSRVRYFREPLFCRRAFLPDPLVHLDHFIHPMARDAFSRLRSLGAASDIERSERIFISRSKIRRRRLSNESEIESLFERYGFRIIHPELLPIEAQIALFSDARMIAGLGGSAMHNTVFTDPDAKVLLVSAKQWFVETDVLINQTAGQLGYVFGEPTDNATDAGDRTWSVDPVAVEAAIAGHFGL